MATLAKRKVSAYQKSKKEVDKVLLNTKWINVRQKNFGWAEMTITDKATGKKSIFNIRPSMVKQAKEEARKSVFTTPQGVLYSKWINTTKQGKLYTDRRQVEGILEVAETTGNTALIEVVKEVLAKGDVYVSDWYHNFWLPNMSRDELDVFYEGSDDTIESDLASLGIVIEE